MSDECLLGLLESFRLAPSALQDGPPVLAVLIGRPLAADPGRLGRRSRHFAGDGVLVT
jgi:hypothetical protein